MFCTGRCGCPGTRRHRRRIPMCVSPSSCSSRAARPFRRTLGDLYDKRSNPSIFCDIVAPSDKWSCDMANDPGLAADTLTYMEAVSGDGGIHDAAGVWWLSPDIQLIGSVSGMDKADPGVDNT